KPWPRERMTPDHLLGEAELTADVAHLVLEQLSQRLDELEPHPRLEPAHVVVRLDRRARAALRAHALDDIGIERPLHEERRVLSRRRRRVLEDINKHIPDRATLLLGIIDPRE